MDRTASVNRKTAETDIEIIFSLDGQGKGDIVTGIGFFDHMLTLWARHGLFDLQVRCAGDLEVDSHHTVEDVGIVLGQAFQKALGKKEGICRYGTAFVPMDDALAMVSLDISGRPYLGWEAAIPNPRLGTMDSDMVEEFFRAFSLHGGITIHARMLAGHNSHHMAEALYKALGRALDQATRIDERIQGVMSTKEML